ncbi:MAG: ATP-dependent sacrificial sulfur transferase LarE [Anaerolineae bacterium]|nr:ATP-dependent sacrificial sulfur transferase LarE [Anaerolineae bacterium]
MNQKNEKINRLEQIIANLESVVVAFSGGVDSTLLLALCVEVLGTDNVLAVTVESAIHPSAEKGITPELAAQIGARQRVIDSDILDDPEFNANSPQRCYFCKRSIMRQLRAIADAEGLAHIVHGANVDDLGDFRPGTRAANEAGARSPLMEAGFRKADIRALSQEMGLPTWDAPSMACLASRFPYGTGLTEANLQRVDAAEEFLRRAFGLRQLRVRDHLPVARIEVPESEIGRLVEPMARAQIVAKLKELGYTYIALDLTGFRSGSLNEVLKQEVLSLTQLAVECN